MTPEELNVFVAKLKEDRLVRRRRKENEYRREWRRKNRSSIREHQRNYVVKHAAALKLRYSNKQLKRLHGITIDEKTAMIVDQGDCCAICGTDSPGQRGWHVDHCHATNNIRGILCAKCNIMLGHCNDDPSILEAAITYLEYHNGKRDQRSIVSPDSFANTQNGQNIQSHPYCY